MTRAPDNSPPWLVSAYAELGKHETGINAGRVVQEYIDLAQCGKIGDPWCAIFANAMLEKNGIHGTRSAWSRSFASNARFFQLSEAALGAVVVFWRGRSKNVGSGHVGFVTDVSTNGQHIGCLGGNESDAVRLEAFPLHSEHFGLIGFYWPKETPIKPQFTLARIAVQGASSEKVT